MNLKRNIYCRIANVDDLECTQTNILFNKEDCIMFNKKTVSIIMRVIHPRGLSWFLALTLGLWVMMAEADEFHYRYISFSQVELTPEFTSFGPAAIQDSGRVYGTVCDDSCSDPHIAYYEGGAVTVLKASGFANTVNAGGTVGGFIITDPQNFVTQAALFRGDDVELIPQLPGAGFASVIALNDAGTALIESDDAATGMPTYVLYSKGQTSPLDFGPAVTNPVFLSFVGGSRFINNAGLLAGMEGNGIFTDERGFRFDPRTGEVDLLDPVPPDTLAWGLGINNRGDVLGYSFVNSSPYHERIGVWDSNGNFHTYFDETISTNKLVFNDNNLIVISLAQDNNSYLVPEPGVRLNLADLVGNLPPGQDLRAITWINNHGDMIGFGSQDSFLLEKIDSAALVSSTTPTPSSGAKNKQHTLPAALVIQQRHMSPLHTLKSGSSQS
jgi:hypothetical protein